MLFLTAPIVVPIAIVITECDIKGEADRARSNINSRARYHCTHFSRLSLYNLTHSDTHSTICMKFESTKQFLCITDKLTIVIHNHNGAIPEHYISPPIQICQDYVECFALLHLFVGNIQYKTVFYLFTCLNDQHLSVDRGDILYIAKIACAKYNAHSRLGIVISILNTVRMLTEPSYFRINFAKCLSSVE